MIIQFSEKKNTKYDLMLDQKQRHHSHSVTGNWHLSNAPCTISFSKLTARQNTQSSQI